MESQVEAEGVTKGEECEKNEGSSQKMVILSATIIDVWKLTGRKRVGLLFCPTKGIFRSAPVRVFHGALGKGSLDLLLCFKLHIQHREVQRIS